MTDTVTREEWHQHVLVNADDAYSLAHCVVAALLAEAGAEDESDWDDIISNHFSGLTGFQVAGAKSIARQIWPLFGEARERRGKTKNQFIDFLQKSAEDGTLIVLGE